MVGGGGWVGGIEEAKKEQGKRGKYVDAHIWWWWVGGIDRRER